MGAVATTRRRGTAQRRIARVERILDAATELVLRWGYDKTTIDDVARRAGVAKGTIYLHWGSREDLFAALMRWDRVEMIGAVRRQLREDPSTATLPGLFGHLAREIHQRPLLQAVLVQDSAVLGKLVARKKTSSTTPEMVAPFGEYLATLRKLGMVRDDLSIEDHLTVVGAVLHGSLVSLRMMPESLRVSDERAGELISDTLARAFAPAGATSGTAPSAAAPTTAPSDAARAACADATREFVDQAYAVARAKLRESLGDDLPPEEGEPS